MPPTLAALVQHSTLKLVVRAGEGGLDREVRWAHVSELADPVPYLEGGELLLVTAITLDVHDRDTMRRYVRRLMDAGVVGLGFAVGVHHDAVPDALLEAAGEADFPLLEVPRRTPFLAIGKVVSAAIAADQYRAVTAGFAVQRELTRAALAGGPGAVLARLAGYLDGWAALYDTSGAVIAAAPDWAARRAARHSADAERLRERSAPASAVVADTDAGNDRVELQSLGIGRRVRGVLAVGTGAPLGTAERYAVHSAIALLTLATERSRSLQQAERRIGAAVLRMLLAGHPDDARAVSGELYDTLLDAPFRVLVAEPADPAAPDAGEALGSLTEALESAASRAGEPVIAVQEPAGRLVVLAVGGGAVVESCADAYADRPAQDPGDGGDPPLYLGLSAATAAGSGPAAAPAALRQAEQALSVARRRGRALVEHGELVAGSVLPLLADDAVRAFADGLLRPLYEHDATGRGDLVASLRAWLSRHGQWDAAAADLGVHRHTLRYRMRRVEEILGRSLDDPDVRMELWLSLKTTEPTTGA
ncbi:PucR family transcriptional regulator [Streptomyces qinzhouensis]|uniref:PucR family transcriptional regulator n=1 Tax=Streptomyces qinzhouensis TaxID=2599401 RepID=A0A5B8JNR7_9ACTN|nr:PucR family transcriptional regulator [Streptomyces qinzhouensis]QDY79283.1 PucR family transcriptional regulator [Streptomyces qinzhouensis]